MIWALLIVGVVLALLGVQLLRAPVRAGRTPAALVALARRYGLDVQGRRASGRVPGLFVHLELTGQPELFGYRRRDGIVLQVDTRLPPALSIRPRRPTDLLGAVVVDEGRFDEQVWITHPRPADAISRLDAPARAAVLRAVQHGARLEAGRWHLERPCRAAEARRLVDAVLAAARALDRDRPLHAALLHHAATDPIVEVRVTHAIHRLDHGDLDEAVVQVLSAALVEGLRANPPVRRAKAAMDRLRAARSGKEVGRISLASVAGGEVAIVEDPPGGQVALVDEG